MRSNIFAFCEIREKFCETFTSGNGGEAKFYPERNNLPAEKDLLT